MSERPIDPKASARRARVLLHAALTSQRGNGFLPVRYARQALAFVNDLAGRPLCSEEDLRRRQDEVREAEQRLEEARRQAPAQKRKEAAPVLVYVTDQDHRTPKKIADILKGRDIPYTVNDVTTDEATASWALTQAHAQEFPLVFIAGEAVGGLTDLMQLDVSGELLKRVYRD